MGGSVLDRVSDYVLGRFLLYIRFSLCLFTSMDSSVHEWRIGGGVSMGGVEAFVSRFTLRTYGTEANTTSLYTIILVTSRVV